MEKVLVKVVFSVEKQSRTLSIWNEVKNIKALLSLLWSAVVVVGGLVLLIFVAGNEFLPELDLPGAVSLLVSVALISLLLVLAIAIWVLLGGLAVYTWFAEWDADERGRISTAVAFISANVVFVWMVFILNTYYVMRITAVGAACLTMVVVIWLLYGRSGCFCQNSSGSVWKEKIGLVMASLIINLPIAVLGAFIFSKIYREQAGTAPLLSWFFLFLWLQIQAGCTGLVTHSATPRKLLLNSALVGLFGVVLLLSLSNNPSFIVQRTVQMLGIGAIENVNLAVTQAGCEVLRVFSDDKLCAFELDKQVYMTEAVTLRSRFGKQLLIEYISKVAREDNSTSTKYKIVLEASELLGWRSSSKGE